MQGHGVLEHYIHPTEQFDAINQIRHLQGFMIKQHLNMLQHISIRRTTKPTRPSNTNLMQDLVVTHWNGHAKLALNAFIQKASEKSAQAQKWAEPHLET